MNSDEEESKETWALSFSQEQLKGRAMRKGSIGWKVYILAALIHDIKDLRKCIKLTCKDDELPVFDEQLKTLTQHIGCVIDHYFYEDSEPPKHFADMVIKRFLS